MVLGDFSTLNVSLYCRKNKVCGLFVCVCVCIHTKSNYFQSGNISKRRLAVSFDAAVKCVHMYEED